MSETWVERAAHHVEAGVQYVRTGLKAAEVVNTIRESADVIKTIKGVRSVQDAMTYASWVKETAAEAKNSPAGKALGVAGQLLSLTEGASQLAQGASQIGRDDKVAVTKLLGGTHDLLVGLVPGGPLMEKAADKYLFADKGQAAPGHSHMKDALVADVAGGLDKAAHWMDDKATRAEHWVDDKTSHAGAWIENAAKGLNVDALSKARAAIAEKLTGQGPPEPPSR